MTRPGHLAKKPTGLTGIARQSPDEEMREHTYEQRVLAETMTSPPVMKGFKAMIRAEGLLGVAHEGTVSGSA